MVYQRHASRLGCVGSSFAGRVRSGKTTNDESIANGGSARTGSRMFLRVACTVDRPVGGEEPRAGSLLMETQPWPAVHAYPGADRIWQGNLWPYL